MTSSEGTSSPAELRDRMGRYIAAELPACEQVQRIGWPVSVGWAERSVSATLTRGELVLEAEIAYLHWWEPPKRSRAQEWIGRLAQLLAAYYQLYSSADATGRMYVTAWKGPGGFLTLERSADYAPVLLRLEPGVRTGATKERSSRTA